MISPRDTYVGAKRRLVRAVERGRFGAIGPGSTYDPLTSTITGHHRIFIGRDVFIGRHAVISASCSLVIGDDTVIGPELCVQAGDHGFTTPGLAYALTREGPGGDITIGRNVWIGARVILLKGVTIGDGAVVGAGSVVTRNIPPYTVAVGSPARPIKDRFQNPADRAKHERFVSTLGMPCPRG